MTGAVGTPTTAVSAASTKDGPAVANEVRAKHSAPSCPARTPPVSAAVGSVERSAASSAKSAPAASSAATASASASVATRMCRAHRAPALAGDSV